MSFVHVNDIRTTFLSYFKKHEHMIMPSSSLVPHNDPTLMFTNAGMVQFKDAFTGASSAPSSRVATSQKCVRAGGKHNDLDNVGYTARHHTFFEMLGNFSFGDYFKEEAIFLAWNLLTKEFGISPEKLCVTVFHEDDEARALWKKLTGFSDHKIISIATQDNFWSMGDTGPCGPCSEIFYDHGDHIPGGPPGSKDQDKDRFVEIWNLVFMQFEAQASGEQVALPNPCIDTGMGLERIAAVLQGVNDNYDIDLFKTLISTSIELSGNKEHLVSHRVIADHLRSCAFLMADGVMPSNEGRGYVLRRILRRAMRHIHKLGVTQPLLYQLLPTLTKEMGKAYPELVRAESSISDIMESEEIRFQRTLDKGLKLLETEVKQLSGSVLSGETAFKLHDTYGFPLDLTKDILKDRDVTIDQQGYDTAMQLQKERAKAAWSGSGGVSISGVWSTLYEAHGATEFLGYDHDRLSALVLAIIQKDQVVDQLDQDQEGYVVLNQTPFYAESGGQVGDTGTLTHAQMQVNVVDTKKFFEQLYVHHVKVEKGCLRVGAGIEAHIDVARRQQLRANHTATHLLHHVAKHVLGTHVAQKGSLVAEGRLRLDISHAKQVTQEQLNGIEQQVNEIIQKNYPVKTELMMLEDALETGAEALFGEKYEDEVRVLKVGPSTELCGGTHVKATGEIGLFKIVSESAIAAGVRRIEAVTGMPALLYVQEQEEVVSQLCQSLKGTPTELYARIEALKAEQKKLQQMLSTLRVQHALVQPNFIEKVLKDGVFIGKILHQVEQQDLKNIVEGLKQKYSKAIIAIASVGEDKVSLVVGVAGKLAGVSAKELMMAAAPVIGAKGGGGTVVFAQTGGASHQKTKEALQVIYDNAILAEKAC